MCKYETTPPRSHIPVSLLCRAGEQQREADDSGVRRRCDEKKQQYHTDVILPCPYLLGHRHSHHAKPAQVLSPAMEVKMRRSDPEARGDGSLVRITTLQAEVLCSVGYALI